MNQTQSAQSRLEAIPLALTRHGVMFSKTVSAKLVGGQARLRELIESDKIRVEKKATGKQNGKWYCNGGDVIQYIKF